jgi:transglutaminase-like putative cysteine protease
LRRTACVSAVPAVVIASAWVGLEQPRVGIGRAALVVGLALAPALVERRRALRAAALVVAAVTAAKLAFGFALLHPVRAVARLGSGFADGFFDFYDVRVPFDPRVHGDMRSVVLVALFGFAAALGLGVAARRPVAALLVVLVGAGWPATLAGPAGALGRGVAILLAALIVLGGLTARRIPRTAVPVAAVLAAAAFVLSSSSAVAKGELVRWQSWDFSSAPSAPVSVSYAWDAQYGGLRFPATRTTVLEVEAPSTALYWRAALLDVFDSDRWAEGPLRSADVLVPAAARNPANWVRQVVTVEGLIDTRLIGGGTPLAFDAGEAPVVTRAPGFVSLPSGLTRGLTYGVESYAPQPTPLQLVRAGERYPSVLTEPGSMLDVWPGVTAPPFGAPNRAAELTALLDAHGEISRYVPLEKAALALAKGARSPYAAAVSLESWFRSRGGFTYSSHPAVFAEAPLVGFVVQTREGYCQYFAGAMALMLRYVGVPARVAVGFSSGTYDAKRSVWTVTDHEAHAWVEAWFPGYGWLPFDPTPSAGRPERGRLGAPYSASSPRFTLGSTGIAVAAGPQLPPAQSSHRHGEGGATPGTRRARPVAASGSGHRSSLLVLLGIVLGAALLGVAVTKLAVRRSRYVSRDPRRVAAACRQELADFLLDQRIDAARSATLHELGSLVRDELAVDPDRFVAAATAARFGPPAGARPAARDARRELRALMKVVRARLTLRERARGLLSLRSLGFAS